MFDMRAARRKHGVVALGRVHRDSFVLLDHELRALADAITAHSAAELSAQEERLAEMSDATEDPGFRSIIDALAEASRAARTCLGPHGLASQGGQIEPESLPARMLREIARGARVGNADLAELLATDPWQLSRAGRRLRDAGLATRTRSGRVNTWCLTANGQIELNRIETSERRSRRSI
jgi:hypothetical protein